MTRTERIKRPASQWCRVLGLVAVLLITSCGFRPLYDTEPGRPSAGGELAKVKVQPISDRRGQLLRQHLVEALNPVREPQNPAYLLAVDLNENLRDLGIERDTSVTFARLTMTARYRLIDARTRETLFEGRDQSINSFNVVDEPYATRVAEQDARKRALKDLADTMQIRLASFLSSQVERRN